MDIYCNCISLVGWLVFYNDVCVHNSVISADHDGFKKLCGKSVDLTTLSRKRRILQNPHEYRASYNSVSWINEAKPASFGRNERKHKK